MSDMLLACRFLAMKSSLIVSDKLIKHIGHEEHIGRKDLFQSCAVGDILGKRSDHGPAFFAD